MIRNTVVIVLALLAVATIAAPALLGSSDRDGYETVVRSVLRDADRNNALAEGAPQQQVVNGWVARDLLAVQTAQQNDALELQSRQMALLLVIALLLTWSIVTSPSRSDSGEGPEQSDTTVASNTSQIPPLPQRPTQGSAGNPTGGPDGV